jgi:hypothetical protein
MLSRSGKRDGFFAQDSSFLRSAWTIYRPNGFAEEWPGFTLPDDPREIREFKDWIFF